MPSTRTAAHPHRGTVRYQVPGFRDSTQVYTPELRRWLQRIETAAAEGYSRDLLSAAGTELRTLYGIVDRVDRRMRSAVAAVFAALLAYLGMTVWSRWVLDYIGGDTHSRDPYTWILAHDVLSVAGALIAAGVVAVRSWRWQTRRVVIARDRLNRWLPPAPIDPTDTATAA